MVLERRITRVRSNLPVSSISRFDTIAQTAGGAKPMTQPSHRNHQHAVLAASLTITFVAGLLATTAACAEDTTRCPKAGTVVTVSEGGIARSWTALGPDPEDATMCRKVDGAHRGSIANGSNAQQRLFNWVSLNGMPIYTPDTVERIREAWRAILSGQRNEKSYYITAGWRYQPLSVWSATNTLTRLGQEELPRLFNALN
jgi:hypothetical protein